MSAPRIASLLPSATEIVCALGARESLVGRSHECDHPSGVEALPALTRARLDASGPSAIVDREVRRIVVESLAVYEVLLDPLRAAAPDLVVTQDLCDVCAVTLNDVERGLRELGLEHTRVLSLRPLRLDDVWEDVLRVGRAIGREERARALLAELRSRVEAVRRRTAGLERRPSVLTVEWIDPVIVGGTWMPELVEIAGGSALVTIPGQHAPTLTPEQLAALDPAPEVVLVKPCGFALERTRAEAERLRAWLEPLDWPAVRARRVWLADGNAFFNRPGPRLVESLEILAACLHPERFEDMARRHAGSFERLGP